MFVRIVKLYTNKSSYNHYNICKSQGRSHHEHGPSTRDSDSSFRSEPLSESESKPRRRGVAAWGRGDANADACADIGAVVDTVMGGAAGGDVGAEAMPVVSSASTVWGEGVGFGTVEASNEDDGASFFFTALSLIPDMPVFFRPIPLVETGAAVVVEPAPPAAIAESDLDADPDTEPCLGVNPGLDTDIAVGVAAWDCPRASARSFAFAVAATARRASASVGPVPPLPPLPLLLFPFEVFVPAPSPLRMLVPIRDASSVPVRARFAAGPSVSGS
jgi:hypothetical protein